MREILKDSKTSAENKKQPRDQNFPSCNKAANRVNTRVVVANLFLQTYKEWIIYEVEKQSREQLRTGKGGINETEFK